MAEVGELKFESAKTRKNFCKDPNMTCDGVCVGFSIHEMGWVKCAFFKKDTYMVEGNTLDVSGLPLRKNHP